MGQRIVDWIIKLAALTIAAVWVFNYSEWVSTYSRTVEDEAKREREVGRYAFYQEPGSGTYKVFDTRLGTLYFVDFTPESCG